MMPSPMCFTSVPKFDRKRVAHDGVVQPHQLLRLLVPQPLGNRRRIDHVREEDGDGARVRRVNVRGTEELRDRDALARWVGGVVAVRNRSSASGIAAAISSAVVTPSYGISRC